MPSISNKNIMQCIFLSTHAFSCAQMWATTRWVVCSSACAQKAMQVSRRKEMHLNRIRINYRRSYSNDIDNNCNCECNRCVPPILPTVLILFVIVGQNASQAPAPAQPSMVRCEKMQKVWRELICFIINCFLCSLRNA